MLEKGKKPFHAYPKSTVNKEDLVFGLRPILEALKAGKDLDKIFVEKGLQNPVLDEILPIVQERGLNVQYVPVEKLNRLTRKNHQGIVAFLSVINYAKIENVVMDAFSKGEDPVIVVLDEITDVRNFGAISRSAECAGAHALLIPQKGSAQINSDAMKTSAGALHHIPVCKTDNLFRAVRYLKDSGLKIVACTEKGDKSMFTTSLTGPVCLVLGSEESGISVDILKLADDKTFIPLKGKIDSLNVSVAAGILLFEIARQRAKE